MNWLSSGRRRLRRGNAGKRGGGGGGGGTGSRAAAPPALLYTELQAASQAASHAKPTRSGSRDLRTLRRSAALSIRHHGNYREVRGLASGDGFLGGRTILRCAWPPRPHTRHDGPVVPARPPAHPPTRKQTEAHLRRPLPPRPPRRVRPRAGPRARRATRRVMMT